MVELPGDDDGSWLAPMDSVGPSLVQNVPKKVAKRQQPKLKATSKAQPSSTAGLELPEDDGGLDLGLHCQGVAKPKKGGLIKHLKQKRQASSEHEQQHCEDQSLKHAVSQITSKVENPYGDLLMGHYTPCDTLLRCHLWELFSAPRLTPVMRQLGARARLSYDLKHFWDLGQESFQRAICQDILILRPLCVVLSPPCTYVCQLQHSNWKRMKNENKLLTLTEALHLIDFAMWVAMIQLKLGHFFVFEHPAGSMAWGREAATWPEPFGGTLHFVFDECFMIPFPSKHF